MSDKKSGEGLLSFPAEFTIKIIGQSTETFEAEVVQILRKHFPKLGEGAIELKPSRKQNYLAMSVTLTVDSQEQLDNLYRDLSDNDNVIFAL